MTKYHSVARMADTTKTYTEEESEVLIACYQYRQKKGISFIGITECLKVLKELGYRKFDATAATVYRLEVRNKQYEKQIKYLKGIIRKLKGAQ